MKKQEMLPVIDKHEIIEYQPEGGEFHIEVRVENETVLAHTGADCGTIRNKETCNHKAPQTYLCSSEI